MQDRAANFRVKEAKEDMREGIFFFWGGGGQHACGFLFSFSKVTENAIITIKLFILFLQKSGGGGGG